MVLVTLLAASGLMVLLRCSYPVQPVEPIRHTQAVEQPRGLRLQRPRDFVSLNLVLDLDQPEPDYRAAVRKGKVGRCLRPCGGAVARDGDV